jgi:hypothetical protein
VTADNVPGEIRRLAEARRTARADRDWAEADRLKAEIEAAGWKIVDQGRAFSLARAHPPDVEDGGVVRYGWSGAVPSLLGGPPTTTVTVIRAVADDAIAVAPTDASAQVVLVANRPVAELPAGEPEVVLMNGWPGAGGALNAGIRRASGRVVVLAAAEEPLAEPRLQRMIDALDDPTVAVAGPRGWTTLDLRRFAPANAGDAVAVDGRLMAFRRSDAIERGPLDEAFVDPFRLDVWWSLTLRDEGPDRRPRRAVVLDDVEAASERRETSRGEVEEDAAPVAPEDGARRRNFYRLIRHFGGARHLAQDAAPDD